MRFAVGTPTGHDKPDQEVPAAVTALGALADPVRRTLYRYVASLQQPVGREQVAAAAGLAPHVARFQLDRLVDAGLLEVEYRRPSGRGGPGAGRPTKLYRPSSTDYAASVPERRYDLAGAVLTRAVAATIRDGRDLGPALEAEAARAGRSVGRLHPGSGHGRSATMAAALGALDDCGFATRADGEGGYVLGNCPFRALAQVEPEVICRVNLALVRGVLDEIGVEGATASLDPLEGRCCVTVKP